MQDHGNLESEAEQDEQRITKTQILTRLDRRKPILRWWRSRNVIPVLRLVACHLSWILAFLPIPLHGRRLFYPCRCQIKELEVCAVCLKQTGSHLRLYIARISDILGLTQGGLCCYLCLARKQAKGRELMRLPWKVFAATWSIDSIPHETAHTLNRSSIETVQLAIKLPTSKWSERWPSPKTFSISHYMWYRLYQQYLSLDRGKRKPWVHITSFSLDYYHHIEWKTI